MKSNPILTFSAVILTTILVGCCGQKNQTPFNPAKINHVVFCDLKQSGDTAAFMQDCNAQLATIEGVVTYWCGEHGDFGRDSVDGNYDVGLCIGFNSQADYEKYVNHPQHVQVVGKWGPKLNSLHIYDVVDQSHKIGNLK